MEGGVVRDLRMIACDCAREANALWEFARK